jgi:hypothetical protein
MKKQPGEQARALGAYSGVPGLSSATAPAPPVSSACTSAWNARSCAAWTSAGRCCCCAPPTLWRCSASAVHCGMPSSHTSVLPLTRPSVSMAVKAVQSECCLEGRHPARDAPCSCSSVTGPCDCACWSRKNMARLEGWLVEGPRHPARALGVLCVGAAGVADSDHGQQRTARGITELRQDRMGGGDTGCRVITVSPDVPLRIALFRRRCEHLCRCAGASG